MKASIATVAAVPIPITIGGRPFLVYGMRPYDDGLYERWYQERAIAEMLARGMPPVEAQRCGMAMRYDDPAVQASKQTRLGTMELLWIQLRSPAGLTREQMDVEITDDELIAAIDALNRRNHGPPRENPPTGAATTSPPPPAKRTTWRWLSRFARASRSTGSQTS